MQYSQILWATGFGLLFFGETTDIYTAAGATIIISSGIYIVFRESRGGTSRTTPVLRTRTRFATPSMPRLGDMMRSGRFRDKPMNRGGRE
jgi:hypothetical protein